jgi:DNA replication protein DnaC
MSRIWPESHCTQAIGHQLLTDWTEFSEIDNLGGGRIADAIMDRIIHRAHRIEVASKDSMRKNDPSLPHAGHSDI